MTVYDWSGQLYLNLFWQLNSAMRRHWLIAHGDEKRLKKRLVEDVEQIQEHKQGEINEEHQFYDGRC